MQGNGNDFILIDEYEHPVIPDEMKAQFAGLYCDRRYGIGGDGVLYLSRSSQADLHMRLFQPDESEAEMCGNGIRCFVKYAFDAGYVGTACLVETLAGIIRVEMAYSEDTFMATIDMPDPRFDRKEIPATGDGEYRESIAGHEVYAVNTGYPMRSSLLQIPVLSNSPGLARSSGTIPPFRKEPMSMLSSGPEKIFSVYGPSSAALRGRPSPAERVQLQQRP